MIIWINGAFGSGKSSTAQNIYKKIKLSHLYDPELAGFFIWDMFPGELQRKGNFQDIPLWREFNCQALKYIDDNYSGTVIVPMTIYKTQYYNEIIGRLINSGVDVRHFILSADRVTIIKRLIHRGDSEDCWAAQQIDVCLKAFENDIQGHKIETENRNVDDVADEIISSL